MNIKNLLTFAIIFSTVLNSETLTKPTSFSKDLYADKILSGSYIDSIDHPNEFLDFNYGDIGTYSGPSHEFSLIFY